jgi:hypothetical protein
MHAVDARQELEHPTLAPGPTTHIVPQCLHILFTIIPINAAVKIGYNHSIIEEKL